jgi:hypothetical protein
VHFPVVAALAVNVDDEVPKGVIEFLDVVELSHDSNLCGLDRHSKFS